MLKGSIIQDNDEDEKQDDQLNKPKMKAIKKVRTETMRQPIRKNTMGTNKNTDFDDGTSDGSYMVRIPGALPAMPDDQ